MNNSISTCIIYHGDGHHFYRSLSAIRAVTDQVIVVKDAGTGPLSDSKTGESFTYIEFSGHSDPIDRIAAAIEKATGEWILILDAGETISIQDRDKISDLRRVEDVQAYQFILHISPNGKELSKYEWLGNMGKYSRDQVIRSGYIPTIGIRFFKKNAVRKVLSFDGGFLLLDFRDRAKVLTPGIRILAIENNPSLSPGIGDDEPWERDRQRFSDGIEIPPALSESYELIGPGKIGFPLISEEDLPSLEAGLDLGFGQIDILRWAVHKLIKIGAYQKAIDFAETIIDRLSESDGIHEIWHLKGIAYFHMLDLGNAEKSMQKALELDGINTNTLSDLARVYIVAGKSSEARRVLDRSIAQNGLVPENDYIYNVIKQNRDQRAKISLLLICRDEEEYIDRALKSVDSLFDEIIAVDTGSKDHTVDILKGAGAKIVFCPWNDDFSEVRNCGLTHATGDYVFWMDADEYIEDKDRLSFLVFKNLLPLKEKQGVVFDIHTMNKDYDFTDPNIPPTSIAKRTALFPNSPEIRFEGKVFESVDASLEILHIPLIFAESVSIKHHSRNDTFRSERKVSAMKNSIHLLEVEELFQGIQFWLELDDSEEAIRWFERALVKTNGNRYHLNMICKYFDEFKHRDLVHAHPQILRTLLSRYSTSYRVLSHCADYFYELHAYDDAVKLLKQLVVRGGCQFMDEPSLTTIQKNRLHYAMASLEQDDVGTCNEALSLLSADDGMTDEACAISFYSAIRMGELDDAISILDQWIRKRNMPIKGTIDDFTHFIRLIADVAEVVSTYGRFDAADILIRSGDYLAASLTKAM